MRPAAKLTWERVVLVCATLAFTSFVLWLTASHFDASELKALAGVAVGSAAREFLPLLKSLLKPTTDALASGGQLE